METQSTSPPFDPFFDLFLSLVDQDPGSDASPPELAPGDQIPRRVYQFWLGDAPLPEIYRRCLDHNRDVLHQDGFEHQLVTHDEVPSILQLGDGRRYDEIYATIPANSLACKKDLLAAILLFHQGGFALDMSMYIRSLDLVARTASHCVRYRHYAGPKQRAAIPYALPCLFGFLGSRPHDSVFAGVLDGMQSFWLGEDDRRLIDTYTTETFPGRDMKHGWMCQYYINEGLLKTHSRTDRPTRVSVSWDRHVIDIDCVATAYVLKRLCLGRFTPRQFEQYAVRTP